MEQEALGGTENTLDNPFEDIVACAALLTLPTSDRILTFEETALLQQQHQVSPVLLQPQTSAQPQVFYPQVLAQGSPVQYTVVQVAQQQQQQQQQQPLAFLPPPPPYSEAVRQTARAKRAAAAAAAAAASSTSDMDSPQRHERGSCSSSSSLEAEPQQPEPESPSGSGASTLLPTASPRPEQGLDKHREFMSRLAQDGASSPPQPQRLLSPVAEEESEEQQSEEEQEQTTAAALSDLRAMCFDADFGSAEAAEDMGDSSLEAEDLFMSAVMESAMVPEDADDEDSAPVPEALLASAVVVEAADEGIARTEDEGDDDEELNEDDLEAAAAAAEKEQDDQDKKLAAAREARKRVMNILGQATRGLGETSPLAADTPRVLPSPGASPTNNTTSSTTVVSTTVSVVGTPCPTPPRGTPGGTPVVTLSAGKALPLQSSPVVAPRKQIKALLAEDSDSDTEEYQGSDSDSSDEEEEENDEVPSEQTSAPLPRHEEPAARAPLKEPVKDETPAVSTPPPTPSKPSPQSSPRASPEPRQQPQPSPKPKPQSPQQQPSPKPQSPRQQQQQPSPKPKPQSPQQQPSKSKPQPQPQQQQPKHSQSSSSSKTQQQQQQQQSKSSSKHSSSRPQSSHRPEHQQHASKHSHASSSSSKPQQQPQSPQQQPQQVKTPAVANSPVKRLVPPKGAWTKGPVPSAQELIARVQYENRLAQQKMAQEAAGKSALKRKSPSGDEPVEEYDPCRPATHSPITMDQLQKELLLKKQQRLGIIPPSACRPKQKSRGQPLSYEPTPIASPPEPKRPRRLDDVPPKKKVKSVQFILPGDDSDSESDAERPAAAAAAAAKTEPAEERVYRYERSYAYPDMGRQQEEEDEEDEEEEDRDDERRLVMDVADEDETETVRYKRDRLFAPEGSRSGPCAVGISLSHNVLQYCRTASQNRADVPLWRGLTKLRQRHGGRTLAGCTVFGVPAGATYTPFKRTFDLTLYREEYTMKKVMGSRNTPMLSVTVRFQNGYTRLVETQRVVLTVEGARALYENLCVKDTVQCQAKNEGEQTVLHLDKVFKMDFSTFYMHQSVHHGDRWVPMGNTLNGPLLADMVYTLLMCPELLAPQESLKVQMVVEKSFRLDESDYKNHMLHGHGFDLSRSQWRTERGALLATLPHYYYPVLYSKCRTRITTNQTASTVNRNIACKRKGTWHDTSCVPRTHQSKIWKVMEEHLRLLDVMVRPTPAVIQRYYAENSLEEPAATLVPPQSSAPLQQQQQPAALKPAPRQTFRLEMAVPYTEAILSGAGQIGLKRRNPQHPPPQQQQQRRDLLPPLSSPEPEPESEASPDDFSPPPPTKRKSKPQRRMVYQEDFSDDSDGDTKSPLLSYFLQAATQSEDPDPTLLRDLMRRHKRREAERRVAHQTKKSQQQQQQQRDYVSDTDQEA